MTGGPLAQRFGGGPSVDFPASTLSRGSKLLATRYLSLSTGADIDAAELSDRAKRSVHVAFCFLIPSAARTFWASEETVLSNADLQEINKFAKVPRYLGMRSSRVILRSALSALASQTTPEGVRLSKTALGQPIIIKPASYYCSLSYSSECDALVVSRGVSVGVDVESGEAAFSEAMIETFLAPGELRYLATHGIKNLGEELIRFWTMKEALLKLFGTGLSEDIRRIDTSTLKRHRLFTDNSDRRAIVFSSRLSELVPQIERGWISWAFAAGPAAESRLLRMEIYLVSNHSSAPETMEAADAALRSKLISSD
jgi:phosphopantetheinyl transferase